MKVLLVSSTQREINHYLQTGPKHDVLITGLGIAHTTYELTRQLSHHRYDLVLQVGVAGSYGFYNMGDVVVVSKDTFGDIGAFQNESFLSLQELGFQNNHQWFENKNPHLEKLDLPVVVHSRKSFQHTMDILHSVKWNKGVIHGFSYSRSELEFFLNMGWYISFDGSVTFSGKNRSEMEEMVSYVPLNRLLIESDSPFYAPIPVKGTVNSPENLKYIYEYIASKRKMQTLKLNEKLRNNMKKLFDIKD